MNHRRGLEIIGPNGSTARKSKPPTIELRFLVCFFSGTERDYRDATLHTNIRLLAFIRLKSWGRSSEFAADDAGEPLRQIDLAREMGLKRSHVSHAVKLLKKRGALKVIEGRLCPIAEMQ